MIVLFCILLISGIVAGQVVDLSHLREGLHLITSICLAYIMVEVGLEFSVDKRKMRDYGWDFTVAFLAASLPALLWFGYFIGVIHGEWKPALIAGLSCAPTSAGVLFSMMMAAGLSATWVFKKARTLAVLDDLSTILLLTPLQIIIHGFEWEAIVVLLIIGTFLFASFRWQNTILWPTTEKWILGYAIVLTGIVLLIKKTTQVHLEVLIPAFMWGCLVHLRPNNEHPVPRRMIRLDTVIKGGFMLLVGLSFPKVDMGLIPWGITFGHVVALTVLSNLGKCFTFLCYRSESTVRERFALSVAMFPRGEVGAAVLLIGIGYGFGGYVNTLAMLSLAFNLVLTGGFVWIVMNLLKKNNNEV
jgi:Kef-type K+ transport system membrane component KefB